MTVPSLFSDVVIAERFDRQYLWRFRARPVRVKDGDTFTAMVDTGFNGRHEAHIRIEGLDAPELREPGGQEAARRLSETILRWAPEWPLRIVSRQRETVVAETRSFERFVATVFVVQPDGGLRDVRELLPGE